MLRTIAHVGWGAAQKHVKLVDLETMNIHLQQSASVQPRKDRPRYTWSLQHATHPSLRAKKNIYVDDILRGFLRRRRHAVSVAVAEAHELIEEFLLLVAFGLDLLLPMLALPFFEDENRDQWKYSTILRNRRTTGFYLFHGRESYLLKHDVAQVQSCHRTVRSEHQKLLIIFNE